MRATTYFAKFFISFPLVHVGGI